MNAYPDTAEVNLDEVETGGTATAITAAKAQVTSAKAAVTSAEAAVDEAVLRSTIRGDNRLARSGRGRHRWFEFQQRIQRFVDNIRIIEQFVAAGACGLHRGVGP